MFVVDLEERALDLEERKLAALLEVEEVFHEPRQDASALLGVASEQRVGLAGRGLSVGHEAVVELGERRLPR